jgi:hypothetical protein
MVAIERVCAVIWYMLDCQTVVDVLIADEALLGILQALFHAIRDVPTTDWVGNSVNAFHAHSLETSTGDTGWSLNVIVDAAIIPVTCSQLHQLSW